MMSSSRRALRVALAAWPLVELALAILVGQRMGAVWVFAVMAISGALGILVLRAAGRAAVRQLASPAPEPDVIVVDAQGNRLPETAGRFDSHRGLLAVAGLLLLIPGFLSSLLGLTLLVPQVRRSIAERSKAWAAARITGALGPVLASQDFTARPGTRPGAQATGASSEGAPSVEVINIRPTSTGTPGQKAIGSAPEGRADDDPRERS